MDWASGKGHLSVVQCFCTALENHVPQNAMKQRFYKKGHLHVVQFLHSIDKTCTSNAIDWASRNGHLLVVSVSAQCR